LAALSILMAAMHWWMRRRTAPVVLLLLLLMLGGRSYDQAPFRRKRPPPSDRKFVSSAVDEAIRQMVKKMKDPTVAKIFENCYPNTLGLLMCPSDVPAVS
jgi:hypothetical protein